MVQDLSHLIVICGNDEGFVSQRAAECFAILSNGTNSFSHEIIDGTAVPGDDNQSVLAICRQTRNAIETLPFFPGLKIVWLKNANFLGDSPIAKNEASEQGLQLIQNAITPSLPDDVALLISATEFDKRRKFNKFLMKNAMFEEFLKPDLSQSGWEEEVASNAISIAQKYNLTFESNALDLFIHRVSESSRQIISEIEKLDIYLGVERRQITEKDIQIMVPRTRTGIIFEISRAIESQKTDEAIQLIDYQLENGEKPIAIIRAAFIPLLRSMIVARVICDAFSINLELKSDLYKKLDNIPEYAKKIIPIKKDGTPNYFAISLAAKKIRNKSIARLKKDLAACLKADKLLTTSSLNPQLILHQLAISLTS